MRRRIFGLLLAAAVLLLGGGFLAAWSGIYNVAASAGHWPVTAWLLRFVMENAVETYSTPTEMPDLADPARVERGAGHYATGCAPCHGAPGVASNVIARGLLPPPPSFLGAVLPWSPEEMFWIVKHGLKYTAMPPWPAQGRDDEVWAMTAFVLRLKDMSPADYATLTATEGDAVAATTLPGEVFPTGDVVLLSACTRCHGRDGAGRPSGAFPRLDIQGPDYLARALGEYASGLRPSGIMQPVAAALDPAAMARLARHFGAPSGAEGGSRAASAAAAELGRRIATEGVPDRQVAPCSACHGLEAGPDHKQVPNLNDQYSGYLIDQLHLWRAGRRGGGPYSEIMAKALGAISPEEIDAVAAFYAGLPPARR